MVSHHQPSTITTRMWAISFTVFNHQTCRQNNDYTDHRCQWLYVHSGP